MKSIVVVTTQELPSVRSAAIMVSRLRQRYGKERLVVVMTRNDKLSEISHKDVEQAVGAPVSYVFPSDYRISLEAMNKGRPAVLDNHSTLSSSFEKFARSVAGLKIEKSEGQSSTGWLGRLAGRK